MKIVETVPQSLTVLDGVTTLYPFQLAAAKDLPLTTIFKLLRAAPELMEQQHPFSPRSIGTEKRHFTREDKSEAARIRSRLVLVKSPNDNKVPDDIQSLLQHVHEAGNRSLWIELQSLLTTKSETCEDQGWLSLHAAVSLSECPLAFLHVLLQMHPEQLHQQGGRYLRTPLHCASVNAVKSLMACSPWGENDNHGSTSDETIGLRTKRLQMVLEANPVASRVRDGPGQLPLHLASYHGMPVACLESLIQAWPEALCQRDGKHSLYPFLLAACSENSTCSLSDVFLLLLRAPHVLSAAGLVD